LRNFHRHETTDALRFALREDIPEEYREKLTFIPVKTFDEVLAIALSTSDYNAIGKAKKKKDAKTGTKKGNGNIDRKAA
jgi:predicted ATP-dependent protease